MKWVLSHASYCCKYAHKVKDIVINYNCYVVVVILNASGFAVFFVSYVFSCTTVSDITHMSFLLQLLLMLLLLVFIFLVSFFCVFLWYQSLCFSCFQIYLLFCVWWFLCVLGGAGCSLSDGSIIFCWGCFPKMFICSIIMMLLLFVL